METLINRCRRLIAATKTDCVRNIIQQINWNCRLISIRGARGVGKTTLMLQYLKLHNIDYKTMLYIVLTATISHAITFLILLRLSISKADNIFL